MRSTYLCLASLLFVVAAACGPSATGGGDDIDGGNGMCSDGARRCTGNAWESCQGGDFVVVQECADACDSSLGCVLCVPGTGTCNGDTSHACRPDGMGYFDEFCDPVMGSSCNPGSGVCDGACSANTLGQSYIGCDYYATQTSQLVNPSFQFAVAISNTSGDLATVTIDGGTFTTPVTLMVASGEVATRYLPWVPILKTCNTQGAQECGAPEQYGALAVRGAYHVRSTRPVTVYQFSPLDYAMGNTFSFANDASLLLPTNVWTGNYVVASWQAWDTGFAGTMPGLMAVTAHQNGTMVTINTRAATTGGNGAPAFTANVPQTITLNQGDVLQLMSQAGDLTGSSVTADKAVQVIGGHHCTQVPIGSTACDHVEESMFPVEALSTEYLVTSPYLPSLNSSRQRILRVVATEPGTTVTFDPPVQAPANLASKGDFIELANRAENIYVTANHKIIVTEYMVGQDAAPAAGTGDPAMTLAVPSDQYRTSYQFHAPTNYVSNFVNVTAPTGATVTLDGAAIPATSFTAIGASGFGVAKVPLSNTGNGTHAAESSMGFGITVYGYGTYTSYWYPGGLDLTTIPVE